MPAQNTGFKPFWGGQKKAVPSKPAEGGKYKVGMRVTHPKFGAGMIVALKNDGKIINVAFEGQGVKELAAALAPLTVI